MDSIFGGDHEKPALRAGQVDCCLARAPRRRELDFTVVAVNIAETPRPQNRRVVIVAMASAPIYFGHQGELDDPNYTN